MQILAREEGDLRVRLIVAEGRVRVSQVSGGTNGGTVVSTGDKTSLKPVTE